MLPKITPQAQLCQQLQLRIELNPSQMAAQSTLIGTALTADILGVVPDLSLIHISEPTRPY